MELSLTGIKNPSIWVLTHFGSSDLTESDCRCSRPLEMLCCKVKAKELPESGITCGHPGALTALTTMGERSPQ